MVRKVVGGDHDFTVYLLPNDELDTLAEGYVADGGMAVSVDSLHDLLGELDTPEERRAAPDLMADIFADASKENNALVINTDHAVVAGEPAERVDVLVDYGTKSIYTYFLVHGDYLYQVSFFLSTTTTTPEHEKWEASMESLLRGLQFSD